jgi:transcriptional regulator with XRE-family HTH domain
MSRYGKSERQVLNEHIGAQLRTRREELGLTREQCAERAQISVYLLERIETGRTRATAPLLLALSDVLSIRTSTLFGGLARETDAEPDGDWFATTQRMVRRGST